MLRQNVPTHCLMPLRDESVRTCARPAGRGLGEDSAFRAPQRRPSLASRSASDDHANSRQKVRSCLGAHGACDGRCGERPVCRGSCGVDRFPALVRRLHCRHDVEWRGRVLPRHRHASTAVPSGRRRAFGEGPQRADRFRGVSQRGGHVFATLVAFVAVSVIVFREYLHIFWTYAIMQGWVIGVTMRIIAGAMARFRV